MKHIFSLMLILGLALSTLAAKGIVAVRLADCDYFLVYVETMDDYTLMEWMGGYDPEKGDVLFGTMDSFGLHGMYYGRRETQVYIEDYGLDRPDALEQLHEQCE